MVDLYKLARPFLFQTDAEDAHGMTIKAMKMGLVPPCPAIIDPALEQTLWGLKFPNPVGMAAGFDKGAEVIGPILGLGFGFTEVGTVTPKPQAGNERPRVFRDPQNEAVINRLGFPGSGMHAFKSNIEKFLSAKQRPKGIVGINIGMNKTQTEPVKDYTLLIRMLAPMADYLTINISSPNTPGLRDLQSREPLTELLGAVLEERKKACGDYPPPILLKLAPDLNEAQQEEIAQVVLETKIDGLILGNTTLSRPDTLPEAFRSQKGGLSGQPLTELSTRVIHNFYALTKGQIPIIGVGGVSTGAQAYDKIKAGASLVQLYSALVFKGPTVANSINKELLRALKNDGLSHLSQAIGKAHR
jgi:dihydroorotate dehydrogenase